MKRCARCGKRWWFKVPLRYWFRKKVGISVETAPNQYTVATNYHEMADKVYCHPCWPKFLREIGMNR